MSDVTTAELRQIMTAAAEGDQIPDMNSQTQIDAWRAERELEPECQ